MFVSYMLSRVFTGDEENYLREPGTKVIEKNFGVFKIDGEKTERRVNISIFNSLGTLLWTRDIFAKDLK